MSRSSACWKSSTLKRVWVAVSKAQQPGCFKHQLTQSGRRVPNTDAHLSTPPCLPCFLPASHPLPHCTGPPQSVQPHCLSPPSAAPGVAEVLRLYQPQVDDFQVLHCAVPGGHKAELVVDPGPGVLLVVGGEGRAMVRAAAVADVLALDEVQLQPGEKEGGGQRGCWCVCVCGGGGGMKVARNTCMYALNVDS